VSGHPALNNASDYRTNGHYRTPNPKPSPLVHPMRSDRPIVRCTVNCDRSLHTVHNAFITTFSSVHKILILLKANRKVQNSARTAIYLETSNDKKQPY